MTASRGPLEGPPLDHIQCVTRVRFAPPSGQFVARSPRLSPRGDRPGSAGRPGSRRAALSVDEAVRLALEQNLSLQVQRIEPQLQDLTTAQIRSAWTPNVTSTFTNQSSTSPTSSFFSGATTNSLVSDRFNVNVGANQLLPWGGNYTVSWGNSRGKTNSIFDSAEPCPEHQPERGVQPAVAAELQDRQHAAAVARQQEEPRDDRRPAPADGARHGAQRQAARTGTWRSPWPTSRCSSSRSTSRASRSRTTSRASTIGTMAPIDIIEAEAEVARNEESVILAEASITQRRGCPPAAHLRPEDARLLEHALRPHRSAGLPGTDRRRRGRHQERDRAPDGPDEPAEEHRGRGHQHRVLQEPDPARPQRTGRLRPGRPGRHGLRAERHVPARPAGVRREELPLGALRDVQQRFSQLVVFSVGGLPHRSEQRRGRAGAGATGAQPVGSPAAERSSSRWPPRCARWRGR